MFNNELKKISGSVLGIGLDEKKQEILNKNDKVIECFFLDNDNSFAKGKGTYAETINIKKIKKIFRKQSFDYIISNLEVLKPYLRSFIRNSIYLNKQKIYFYNINNYDFDVLEKRYKRYNAKITKERNFVVIDTINTKINVLKNIVCYLSDLSYDVLEYIGNLFVN